MSNKKYDAVVVGSGPNGLSAAITLAQKGHSVVIYEKSTQPGGGVRSENLTLPGFLHDTYSAVHPMGLASPFFRSLPLEKHGLKWINPAYALAHPFDHGTGCILSRSLEETLSFFNQSDAETYQRWISPLINRWEDLIGELLQPIIHWPKSPLLLAQFGSSAFFSAQKLFQSKFQNPNIQALFLGLGAHNNTPLDWLGSSAVGIVLAILAHAVGWPIPQGGSQKITDALVSYFKSLGGEIIVNSPIHSLDQLPKSRFVFLDLSPKQALEIGLKEFSTHFKKDLSNYQYGPAAFKVDWALSDAIPWQFKECFKAATVHVCGNPDEIIYSEKLPMIGQHSERPFVLLSQPSLFDTTRAPPGKHTAWAYCHVPNALTYLSSSNSLLADSSSVIEKIENQIERFAPGFKNIILSRHILNPSDLENRNPNFVGGDILGGKSMLKQIIFRPTMRLNPYSTSIPGVYFCSASTPPGPGVHGMSGYLAARSAVG